MKVSYFDSTQYLNNYFPSSVLSTSVSICCYNNISKIGSSILNKNRLLSSNHVLAEFLIRVFSFSR